MWIRDIDCSVVEISSSKGEGVSALDFKKTEEIPSNCAEVVWISFEKITVTYHLAFSIPYEVNWPFLFNLTLALVRNISMFYDFSGAKPVTVMKS